MSKESKLNERSGADYAILKEDSYKYMFLDSQGRRDHSGKFNPRYISYRQFIVRAMWKNMQKNQKDPKEIIEAMSNMEWENIKNIQVPERLLRGDSVFTFYKCHNVEGAPYLLIAEKSKGCYPLLLHDDAMPSDENSNRATGFGKAVKDINKNFDKIFEILSNNIEKWDKDLEEKLDKHYHFEDK